MKAQNLTISVPYNGCDKNCPYCVSRMTGYVDTNSTLINRNLTRVRKVAEAAQVSSVLLTGKGEPCMNPGWVDKFLEKFFDYPIELQTNGLILLQEAKTKEKLRYDRLEIMRDFGLNVLALSLDKMEDFNTFMPLFQKAHDLDLVIRVTLNITKMLPNITVQEILETCKMVWVDQLSFRQITIPNHTVDSVDKEPVEWIRKNVSHDQYHGLIKQISNMAPRIIRQLPYGATVYDVNGIAVTWFDYCVQDQHGIDDIRSLIFMEDGHLYTAWNSRASILF